MIRRFAGAAAGSAAGASLALLLTGCVPPEPAADAGAAREPVPATAATAGLSRAQAERLAMSGIPVALPFAIPAGFTAAVEVPRSRNAGAAVSYRVLYTGDSGSCFAVEGTARGGLGGPVPEHQRPFAAPEFVESAAGEQRIYWSERPEPGFPAPMLFSDWMEGAGLFHRLVSGTHLGGGCSRISPELGSRIAESLRLLEADGAPRLQAARFERLDPGGSLSASTPRRLAERVLERIGVLGGRETDAGRRAEESWETFRVDADTAVVLRVVTNLRDDSVAAERYVVEASREGDEWVLLGVGRQVRCQQGRGHASWSPRPCL